MSVSCVNCRDLKLFEIYNMDEACGKLEREFMRIHNDLDYAENLIEDEFKRQVTYSH